MIYTRRYTAEGAITAYSIVKVGSSDTQVIQASSVVDRFRGVYVGPSDAANADSVEICLLGECYMAVSGAIGRGMTLTTNSSGQGVQASPVLGLINQTIGVALISGTSTNIPVFVHPGWRPTNPILTGTETKDWADLATGASLTEDVTVTGAALGDMAWATMTVSLQGMNLSAYVSATNTVTCVLTNNTGGNVNLGSGTLRALVMEVS